MTSAASGGIAELFGVHESFVYKLLRQKRERSDIAPLPHGGGATATLTEAHLMKLTDFVAANPDARLDELREQMRKKARVEVSLATRAPRVASTRLAVKKKSKRASEADPEERAAFQEKQVRREIERLIFMDEFAINLAMTRTRARAPIGERAAVVAPGALAGRTSPSSLPWGCGECVRLERLPAQ